MKIADVQEGKDYAYAATSYSAAIERVTVLGFAKAPQLERWNARPTGRFITQAKVRFEDGTEQHVECRLIRSEWTDHVAAKEAQAVELAELRRREAVAEACCEALQAAGVQVEYVRYRRAVNIQLEHVDTLAKYLGLEP